MLPSFVKETLTSRKGMLVEECQLVNSYNRTAGPGVTLQNASKQ